LNGGPGLQLFVILILLCILNTLRGCYLTGGPELAQPVGDRLVCVVVRKLLVGRVSLNRNSRTIVAVLALTLCSIGASTLASGQDSTKPAIEKKWRPRDGIYGLDPGKAGPCESFPLSDIELSKHSIGSNEIYKCNIKKVTDAAPGVLRLDASCDHETHGKYRDVITFRKIDETSFFARSAQFGRSSSRLVYCRGVDEPAETNWPYDLNGSEAERKQAEKNGAWEPLYGVYARPGDDFYDRCMKAADVVIDNKDISLSGGASHCAVTSTEERSKDYTSLNAVCDQNPNAVGVVMRKNGNFVAPGSEKIAISKTGDRTITLKKSRGGEFSEPAQPLAYCPDPAQRAYADSKKAK